MSSRLQWNQLVCRTATFLTASLILLSASELAAQQLGSVPAASKWRRVGGTTVEAGLAGPAGGPVVRVWFAAGSLHAKLPSGAVFQLNGNSDRWSAARASETAPLLRVHARAPEPGARVAEAPFSSGQLYAAGRHLWSSEDGGAHWTNRTEWEGRSILGGDILDLAISPDDPDVIAVATAAGVWRSSDGGASWSGLNESLPNFPAVRVIGTPGARNAARVLLPGGAEAAWESGNRGSWKLMSESSLVVEQERFRHALLSLPDVPVSTTAQSGDTLYAGSADGRLFRAPDGISWQESPRPEGAGAVLRIFASGRDGRFAVAITAAENSGRVLRTVNGGVFWDDITSDLPPGLPRGITADPETGAVYVATASGLFHTYTDAQAPSPATGWQRLAPFTEVSDAALDETSTELYIASASGLYAGIAPHRSRRPRVVAAGDRSQRAVAPGALLSVVGRDVESATAGSRRAAVLAAAGGESQVQLPWELPENNVTVVLASAEGNMQVGLPVAAASPAIFLDPDGSPVITAVDTGLTLDADSPARGGSRIQILATGLGRVRPDWPVGLAAPLQNPPAVAAAVRAFLDRQPLKVVRATLAPGYTGLYLVELQVPSIVNRGPAELTIEAAGAVSNRVRLWLEP